MRHRSESSFCYTKQSTNKKSNIKKIRSNISFYDKKISFQDSKSCNYHETVRKQYCLNSEAEGEISTNEFKSSSAYRLRTSYNFNSFRSSMLKLTPKNELKRSTGKMHISRSENKRKRHKECRLCVKVKSWRTQNYIIEAKLKEKKCRSNTNKCNSCLDAGSKNKQSSSVLRLSLHDIVSRNIKLLLRNKAKAFHSMLNADRDHKKRAGINYKMSPIQLYPPELYRNNYNVFMQTQPKIKEIIHKSKLNGKILETNLDDNDIQMKNEMKKCKIWTINDKPRGKITISDKESLKSSFLQKCVSAFKLFMDNNSSEKKFRSPKGSWSFSRNHIPNDKIKSNMQNKIGMNEHRIAKKHKGYHSETPIYGRLYRTKEEDTNVIKKYKAKARERNSQTKRKLESVTSKRPIRNNKSLCTASNESKIYNNYPFSLHKVPNANKLGQKMFEKGKKYEHVNRSFTTLYLPQVYDVFNQPRRVKFCTIEDSRKRAHFSLSKCDKESMTKKRSVSFFECSSRPEDVEENPKKRFVSFFECKRDCPTEVHDKTTAYNEKSKLIALCQTSSIGLEARTCEPMKKPECIAGTQTSIACDGSREVMFKGFPGLQLKKDPRPCEYGRIRLTYPTSVKKHVPTSKPCGEPLKTAACGTSNENIPKRIQLCALPDEPELMPPCDTNPETKKCRCHKMPGCDAANGILQKLKCMCSLKTPDGKDIICCQPDEKLTCADVTLPTGDDCKKLKTEGKKSKMSIVRIDETPEEECPNLTNAANACIVKKKVRKPKKPKSKCTMPKEESPQLTTNTNECIVKQNGRKKTKHEHSNSRVLKKGDWPFVTKAQSCTETVICTEGKNRFNKKICSNVKKKKAGRDCVYVNYKPQHQIPPTNTCFRKNRKKRHAYCYRSPTQKICASPGKCSIGGIPQEQVCVHISDKGDGDVCYKAQFKNSLSRAKKCVCSFFKTNRVACVSQSKKKPCMEQDIDPCTQVNVETDTDSESNEPKKKCCHKPAEKKNTCSLQVYTCEYKPNKFQKLFCNGGQEVKTCQPRSKPKKSTCKQTQAGSKQQRTGLRCSLNTNKNKPKTCSVQANVGPQKNQQVQIQPKCFKQPSVSVTRPCRKEIKPCCRREQEVNKKHVAWKEEGRIKPECCFWECVKKRVECIYNDFDRRLHKSLDSRALRSGDGYCKRKCCAEKPVRREREIIDCVEFSTGPLKYLWLYRRWPWFYDYFIYITKVIQTVGQMCLATIVLCVWAPCLLCFNIFKCCLSAI